MPQRLTIVISAAIATFISKSFWAVQQFLAIRLFLAGLSYFFLQSLVWLRLISFLPRLHHQTDHQCHLHWKFSNFERFWAILKRFEQYLGYLNPPWDGFSCFWQSSFGLKSFHQFSAQTTGGGGCRGGSGGGCGGRHHYRQDRIIPHGYSRLYWYQLTTFS